MTTDVGRPSLHAVAHEGAPAEASLRPGEPLGRGLRRLAVTHLDHAIRSLVAPSDRDLGVHEARKSLKRVRALLRLVRDRVGRWTYRQENVVLRDAARAVAPVRDGAVLVVTLDRLIDRYGGVIARGVWDDERAELEARRRAAVDAVFGDERRIGHVVGSLRLARNRLSGWPVDGDPDAPLTVPDDMSVIAPGIARVYRRGREAMFSAAERREEARLHLWRKRVKYLRHQYEALEPIWPAMLGAMASEAGRLGDLLGDEHDLAVLTGFAGEERTPARRLLEAVATRERRDLQDAALAIGTRLYVEPADAHIERLAAYWASRRDAPASGE
ncbi:MAG: CHAD domain-containing protein [Acidimicrobiia bacterium]|nr:CHAD domain-containing protein [Acidimicrobiia bacterium]